MVIWHQEHYNERVGDKNKNLDFFFAYPGKVTAIPPLPPTPKKINLAV